jgi:hypothetical protein
MMSGSCDNGSYTRATERQEGGGHLETRARYTADDGCSAESAISVDDESFNDSADSPDCLVDEPVATTRLVRSQEWQPLRPFLVRQPSLRPLRY